MSELRKYPRTQHLEGSRLQPGDHDLAAVPFAAIAGEHLVVEEKVDGANAAISFARSPHDTRPTPRLQSRGHFLTGGPRERHFELLKRWAAGHAEALHAALGTRYVMYGEWLYAKHTIFYDALPHYFLEFDVLDSDTGDFLSTPRRLALLAHSPVVSVPVLREGRVDSLATLTALIVPSRFKTERWPEQLAAQATRAGVAADRARAETDPSALGEGLYVKTEANGVVTGRYKFVRAAFLQSVAESGSHWLSRPIVPNLLGDGVDLFGARATEPT